jgi:uncharacterized membrane protein YuzA (DUF378 family)
MRNFKDITQILYQIVVFAGVLIVCFNQQVILFTTKARRHKANFW